MCGHCSSIHTFIRSARREGAVDVHQDFLRVRNYDGHVASADERRIR